MKNILLLFGIVLIAVQGRGQLLNGSFESGSAIPTSLGQWSLVDNWNNAYSSNASPDYFHVNANVIADLPETPMAIVSPFEGNAVMGLTLCAKYGANKREYISTQFDSPLEIGSEYHLSFRLTNGQITPSSLAGLAVDGIGILLTTDIITQPGSNPIIATPQFTIDSVFYSEKWEKVIFSFIADQPYLHLTFGLFDSDSSHVITRLAGNNPQFGYYFVDDFTLTTELIEEEIPAPIQPDDTIGQVSETPYYVPNAFTPNNDGENDVFVPIAGYITEWQLEVYTKWGDSVFHSSNPHRGWDGTFAGKPCANGSYIWKITYEAIDNDGDETKFVSDYGFVNLVK